MLLLAVDTSGRYGSIALVREQAGQLETVDMTPLEGGTFSAQLIPQISNLLAKHGINKPEVDALVVVSGPGSFTGLRVGLAAIKGLAEVLRKPIVPVSLLEVVALFSGMQDEVTALLDAGRSEMYVGEYWVAGESARMKNESLLPVSEFSPNSRSVVTPDETLIAPLQKKSVSVLRIQRPGANVVARVGRHRLAANQTVSPEALEANYIRRSDAEIFAKND